MGSVKGVLLELEELKVENARLQEKVTEFEDAYLLLNPHSMERPDPGTVKINLEMFLSEYESLRAYKAECSGRELDPYDAGYLNDFGGGNVGWWHDYIRSELDRAHDHYASQVTIPSDRVADKPAADGEGCICQSCENHYKADLLVPDGV